MSDWKCYQLKNLGVIKTGKTPPSSCKDAFSNTGVPFVTPKDMNGVKTIFKTERYLSKIGLDSVKNYLVPKNSIAVSCIGSDMGKAYLLSEDSVTNQQINTLIVNKNHNFEFIYYKLSIMQDYLKSIAGGSATPILNKSHFSEIEIELPDLDTQNNFVEKLKYLDKKIQLNTQINQTLEQIAQALFKSWFVDFDPVRAKVQALSDGLSLEQAELAAMQSISGKTPEELTALSQTQPDHYAELAETAKAFPCEMVEVDGVEVPKGWEVKPLPEIIDFLEGPGIRNWQYTDEEDGIKFINIRCIQNGDLTLTTANKITKEEAFGKYKHFQLEEDDIVVSTSGTLGRFAFVRKEHLPLSLNTSVIRFRPIKNKSTLGFIAGFVENQLQHELEIRASGSAQRNFGPTHLKQIALLVPDFKLLELHQKYASSLFEKRKQLLSEIDVLKDTRDLLLPKLLNGEGS
jgi:putative type I restriction enzyme hindVIIP specificity protein